MAAYHQPDTLAAALRIAAQNNVVVLAGGTDVYPAKTARAGWGQMHHADILDISKLPGLRGIEDRGCHWWIGALTTWTDLVAAELPPLFDGLKAAARDVGGIQIQNRGTLVGNCCTASPAGDGIPSLLALDAEFEICGGVAFRVPAVAFFTGYRRTAITDCGELVTGIRIPKQPGQGHFLKLGARRYLVISIAMVAGVVDAGPDGVIRSAKIAVGACSAVALRLPKLEARLVGLRPDQVVVTTDDLADLAPIDDIRASGAYRRAAALQLLSDLLTQHAGPTRRLA
jgi:CO/xanthine dehydrogenase FAD-binding subunit